MNRIDIKASGHKTTTEFRIVTMQDDKILDTEAYSVNRRMLDSEITHIFDLIKQDARQRLLDIGAVRIKI